MASGDSGLARFSGKAAIRVEGRAQVAEASDHCNVRNGNDGGSDQ